MIATVTAAGYIVSNNEAIHGYGATADAARADFLRTMGEARITVLGDDDDSTEHHGSWTRESDYRIRSATAALLAEVEGKGGAITWGTVGGVCCTVDEADGEEAA